MGVRELLLHIRAVSSNRRIEGAFDIAPPLLPSALGCHLDPLTKVVVAAADNPVVSSVEFGEVDLSAIPFDMEVVKWIRPLNVGITVFVLNVVDIDAHHAVAALVASLDLVLHPLPVGCLVTDQHHGYSCTL